MVANPSETTRKTSTKIDLDQKIGKKKTKVTERCNVCYFERIVKKELAVWLAQKRTLSV